MQYTLKKQPTLKRQEKLDKKKKLLKRLTFIFLTAIVILLLWIVLFKNRIYIKKYENDNFSFNYDSTWTLSKDSNNNIGLTHKTNSLITIKRSNLTSKNLNSSIENIADEIRFDIEKQNTSYKLLKEEVKNISKHKYESYKMLYENDESQSLVVLIKNDNYVYVINYISSNNTFDIVLDSFQTVLGTLEFK